MWEPKTATLEHARAYKREYLDRESLLIWPFIKTSTFFVNGSVLWIH